MTDFRGRTCGECAWWTPNDLGVGFCRAPHLQKWMQIQSGRPACPAFVPKDAPAPMEFDYSGEVPRVVPEPMHVPGTIGPDVDDLRDSLETALKDTIGRRTDICPRCKWRPGEDATLPEKPVLVCSAIYGWSKSRQLDHTYHGSVSLFRGHEGITEPVEMVLTTRTDYDYLLAVARAVGAME